MQPKKVHKQKPYPHVVSDTDHVYPRTLEEAFGPYERGPVHEPTIIKPYDAYDIAAAVAVAIALIGLLVMVVMGWLPGSGQ